MRARVRVDELMDDPAIDGTEHDHALAGLVRLNAWSRSHWLLWPRIAKTARQVNANGRTLRVLDVATGSGDGPIAMARRAGVALVLDDLDQVARRVPVLANLFPSGDRLMEDFYYAGGLPALMNRIGAQLSLGELTVTGRSLGENIAASVVQDDEVIRPLDRPVSSSAALVVLRGNLAPEGAVR